MPTPLDSLSEVSAHALDEGEERTQLGPAYAGPQADPRGELFAAEVLIDEVLDRLGADPVPVARPGESGHPSQLPLRAEVIAMQAAPAPPQVGAALQTADTPPRVADAPQAAPASPVEVAAPVTVTALAAPADPAVTARSLLVATPPDGVPLAAASPDGPAVPAQPSDTTPTDTVPAAPAPPLAESAAPAEPPPQASPAPDGGVDPLGPDFVLPPIEIAVAAVPAPLPEMATVPLSDLNFEGGVVRDGVLHVRRRIDAELPEALLRGELCFVQGHRQSGKSGLLARTRAALLDRGARCVAIHLSSLAGLGAAPAPNVGPATPAAPDQTGAGEEPFYRALADRVAADLGLADAGNFFRNDPSTPPLLRWQRYLRREVLASVTQQVVILLDDVDLLRALPVSRAGFFGALKASQDSRASDPEYRRLSFALFSAVGSAELSADAVAAEVAPAFTAGRTFALHDFTAEEARAFLPGLPSRPGGAQLWLDAILQWTAGHPALTDRLCQAVARAAGQDPDDRTDEKERVEAVVQELFLPAVARRPIGSATPGQGPPGAPLPDAAEGRPTDPVLLDIARRLGKDNPHAAGMLAVYARLCEGQRVGILPGSQPQLRLRDSGLVVERRDDDGPHLAIRNRVFAAVFDRAWVKEQRSQSLLALPLHRYHANGRHPDHLLSGDELSEAVRWAGGREDLAAQEIEFLFASQQAAIEAERNKTEEAGVQRALLATREQERRQRLLGLMLGAFAAVVVALLGTIGWLAHGKAAARSAQAQAEGDRAQSLIEQEDLRQDLSREQVGHKTTQGRLSAALAGLAQDRQVMDDARLKIGQGETRSGEITGKLDKLFKKRITTAKGHGTGPDTGISKDVVDKLMLYKAWPALRGCYPLGGPLPRSLAVEVTVQPGGEISEATAQGAGAQAADAGGGAANNASTECVVGVLKGLHFTPFGGAHYVKIGYRFQQKTSP